MSAPRRRHDPLALLAHGAALIAIVAIGAYVFFAVRSAPPAQPARPQAKAARSPLAPGEPVPRGTIVGSRQIVGTLVPYAEAGRTWRYAVRVEPPVWRDITLTYQTLQEREGLAVQADFRHAGGANRFRLGRLAAGDPAHANARFPGFFLHAAYIEFPLHPGQTVIWQWPWRAPNEAARPGRIKRYEGKVTSWQMLKVPAGDYNTVRIDATLRYIEDGRVHAAVHETLWIAPKVLQVVRVEREGRSPDEAAQRIVAELVEFR